MSGYLLFLAGVAAAQDVAHQCPTEPGEGAVLRLGKKDGGMNGVGWDGIGQGSASIFFHVEGSTPDYTTPGQRQALINAMQTWANVVQITFVEIPVPDIDRSVDWNFATGDHCSLEGAECLIPTCPFDGAGGVLAHAGFPPLAIGSCPGLLTETMAGNVHFDEAETWEQDSEGPVGAFSMTLIAAHEVGHSLGLIHDDGPGGPHIMRSSFLPGQVMQAPSSSDISNLRLEYAAGTGSVVTLEQLGIWVDGGWSGEERGTQALPFDTVTEGVNAVPPFSQGIEVRIDSGTYSEGMTINRSMTLISNAGAVTIGG